MDSNFITKYDKEIPPELLVEYFEKLTGRVFKILPMREEEIDTLSSYIEYLVIELNGGQRLIVNDLSFLELMMNLESLEDLMCDMPKFKSQVFKCVKLCKKISKNISRNGCDSSGV